MPFLIRRQRGAFRRGLRLVTREMCTTRADTPLPPNQPLKAADGEGGKNNERKLELLTPASSTGRVARAFTRHPRNVSPAQTAAPSHETTECVF